MAGTLTVQNLQGPSSGANANTVLIPSGQTLYAPGHVLQVQTGIIDRLDMSTTTFTDIGSLTITPSSTSSKIYITVTNHVYLASAASSGVWRGSLTQIYRDASVIVNESGQFGSPSLYANNNTDRIMMYSTIDYLDSPSTTSQISYAVKVASRSGDNIDFNNASYGRQGRITLMEIAQ